MRGCPPETYPLILIIQVWAVALVLINPLGNFPIADDWAYLPSVKALVEHGQLVYSNWTAPNLVSQIAWGALFALPFGTSYTVLRLSTELLAVAAAVALYLTLRECKTPPVIATAGALLFLLNPLVCVLSASFMSDVPYAAMQSLAMLFLIAGLRSASRRTLGLGWGMAGLALLCRQVGMAIPLGFGTAAVARGSGWQSISRAFMPFAGFAAFQVLFQAALRYTHIMPANFDRQIDDLTANVFGSGFLNLSVDLIRFALDCFYYLGAFLLPLSLPVVAQFARSLPRGYPVLVWFWISTSTLFLFWFGPQMPFWQNNIILRWSLGGVDVIGVPTPDFFWDAITALSAFGGVMLLAALALNFALVAREIRSEAAMPGVFAVVTALALLGPVALLPRDTQFDRYLIPVLPCLIIFLSMRLRVATAVQPGIPRWATIAGSAVFVAIATYSVLGTHDFLEEKRVQWAALQVLVQNEHIPPETIDADWVYNAPTSFGVYGDPDNLATWFKTPDYLVYSDRKTGIADRPGYSLLRTYLISRWAPWAQEPGDIVVMHRRPRP